MCLVAIPVHAFPLLISHLRLYRKALSGMVQSPGREMERTLVMEVLAGEGRGEENVACRQIPSNQSPLLVMKSLPARNLQVKAEHPHLPQLAGRDTRHRPRLSSPLKVGGRARS